jgi:hypothetical protein
MKGTSGGLLGRVGLVGCDAWRMGCWNVGRNERKNKEKIYEFWLLFLNGFQNFKGF